MKTCLMRKETERCKLFYLGFCFFSGEFCTEEPLLSFQASGEYIRGSCRAAPWPEVSWMVWQWERPLGFFNILSSWTRNHLPRILQAIFCVTGGYLILVGGGNSLQRLFLLHIWESFLSVLLPFLSGLCFQHGRFATVHIGREIKKIRQFHRRGFISG